jgi:hypothetical protein
MVPWESLVIATGLARRFPHEPTTRSTPFDNISPKRQPRAVSRHDTDEAPVGLCVRVPKTLHRALKLHCTVREVMIEAFVE